MITKLSTQTSRLLQQGYLCCLRNAYAVIKISGVTALEYLQGQITRDIQHMTENQGLYSAILTPQGKIICDFHLISGHHQECLILVNKDYAVPLVGRLRQYALGHALRIGMVDSLKVISVQGQRCDDFLQENNLPVPAKPPLSTKKSTDIESYAIRMPEASEHGLWVISDDAEALIQTNSAQVDEAEIQTARILKGTPTFGIDWNEKIFPLNANLIEFEGVSFEKGCYVGQEVTSRMHWRGGIKKRFYRVQLESAPQEIPCPISTTVKIGSITSAAINADDKIFGIAHLPIESVESGVQLINAQNHPVQVLEACHV